MVRAAPKALYTYQQSAVARRARSRRARANRRATEATETASELAMAHAAVANPPVCSAPEPDVGDDARTDANYRIIEAAAYLLRAGLPREREPVASALSHLVYVHDGVDSEPMPSAPVGAEVGPTPTHAVAAAALFAASASADDTWQYGDPIAHVDGTLPPAVDHAARALLRGLATWFHRVAGPATTSGVAHTTIATGAPVPVATSTAARRRDASQAGLEPDAGASMRATARPGQCAAYAVSRATAARTAPRTAAGASAAACP